MRLNKRYIIVAIVIILVLLLLCWKQCATSSSVATIVTSEDTTKIQPNTAIKHKTDTIIKILNIEKKIKDTIVKNIILTQKDTIFQQENAGLVDSLKNVLTITNKEYQIRVEKEEEYTKEISFLKNVLKQKGDSIERLLTILEKERLDNLLEKKKSNEKIVDKKEYIRVKNILFTGLYPDAKTGEDQTTIYGGLIKQVALLMDFITNIPVKPENRKQTVYIKISDLQTEQLIYITDQKPKDSYELADGQKVSYSLQSQITFNQNNMANLKITYPMKWTLKRNSAIKIEVFYNKEKIGEHIDEIKSGIPVTTW